MKIRLNGEECEVGEGVTLRDFVDQDRSLSKRTGIAIAVNEQVVRRDEWPQISLKAGDTVLVIQATQGG